MSAEEEDYYTTCPGCEEVVPKYHNYCPKCGARLFRPSWAPLLLVAGGLYLLNMILIILLFAPFLLTVTIFEMAAAILLMTGRKSGGYIGLMLSILNPIFLLYYLGAISFNYIALLLIIIHLASAYLIIREWEELA
mgnify:CR=1 FL=1